MPGIGSFRKPSCLRQLIRRTTSRSGRCRVDLCVSCSRWLRCRIMDLFFNKQKLAQAEAVKRRNRPVHGMAHLCDWCTLQRGLPCQQMSCQLQILFYFSHCSLISPAVSPHPPSISVAFLHIRRLGSHIVGERITDASWFYTPAEDTHVELP